MGLMLSKLVEELHDPLVWKTVLIGGLFLLSVPVSMLFKYRKSIQRRLKAIEEPFRMIRTNPNVASERSLEPRAEKEIRCLELNPEFVELHKGKWKLVSLGKYLESLRPSLPGGKSNDDLPKFIERELEATIGSVLIRALGRRLTGALLPIIGITDLESRFGSVAGTIASWWASHFFVSNRLEQLKQNNLDYLVDAGTFPMDLNELIAFANLHEKFMSSRMEIPPLEWMRRGEIAYDPTYGKVQSNKEDLIPNPFIVSKHWNKAIAGLEKLIMEKDTEMITETPNAEIKEKASKGYDPDDRSFPEPVPVNERLLPDLYLGWGGAQCTHTKREILVNRLVAVLLNKLSHNFYKKEQKQNDLFVLRMEENSEACVCPEHFMGALIEKGHTVEMCPRSNLTTFGVAACIKEKDGSWSNIPLAVFLRSGYERQDSRPAFYGMPHGGMDVTVTGPLIGKDRTCDIQFYMAIEGLCGWHSNHNADVPWLKPTASTNVYNKDQALLGVRLAGILAATFNAIGTEMDLPFGGYGILGVCNDAAGLLDYAIRGETNMHPLVSTGRFLMHTGRRLIKLQESLHALPRGEYNQQWDEAISRLISATCKIQSDLHASPSNLISSWKRYLASQPKIKYFELEVESTATMTQLEQDFEKFNTKIGP